MHRPEPSPPKKTGEDLDAAADHALVRLTALFRDDLEGLRGMIDEYLQESGKLIAKMRKAVRTGELPQLRDAAHTLKSNAVVFGELALSRACAALEVAPQSVSKESIELLLSRLVNEQDRARVMLVAKYRVLMSAIQRR